MRFSALRQRCFSCVEAFFSAFKPRCSALSFQNANIRICFHSETDFAFKFRVPASILSQILVPGVEFCQEGVVGLGHGGRLRGFAPVGFSHSSSRCSSHSFSRVRIVGFAPVVGFTCADPAFLPPSAFSLIFTCADLAFLPPSLMLSRTAARARSAQGASQFAACYAAVRFTHHSDGRPVHIMKTS